MKYIKNFENNTITTKNKILIVDTSPSFSNQLINVLSNVKLYLDDNFTVLLSKVDYVIKHDNINLKNLIKLLKKNNYVNFYATFNSIQNSVDYINMNNLIGNILIISDGYDNIDTTNINNYCSMLVIGGNSSAIKVKGNCDIFYGNFDDEIYLPKYNTIEEYIEDKTFNNNIKKYNL